VSAEALSAQLMETEEREGDEEQGRLGKGLQAGCFHEKSSSSLCLEAVTMGANWSDEPRRVGTAAMPLSHAPKQG
jgi:hypothetical protein